MQDYEIRDLGFLTLLSFVSLQNELWQKRVEGKILDTFIFAEHPPTISVSNLHGDNDLRHLRVSFDALSAMQIPVVVLDRGGSIAVHGPGILGCYGVMKISNALRAQEVIVRLERWITNALAHENIPLSLMPFNLLSNRDKYRGLWHDSKKIGTRGIRLSQRVSRFGFNINVNPDNVLLNLIHPCGITEYTLGSLEQIKSGITVERVKNLLKNTPA